MWARIWGFDLGPMFGFWALRLLGLGFLAQYHSAQIQKACT